MAQRTICLCEGKYIGIESIFTIVNGKQINIPEMVEALRRKSRANKLVCPCGCGAILTLVAGDKNLREQHFRLKEGQYEKSCQLVTERKGSVESKIVLKCWLDDKLKDINIESRVPICRVDDVDKKYEFTFLSREKSIAISYSYEDFNLSDEKFEILDGNSKDISIIYIVNLKNNSRYGQYPENLMKIQKRQGYCLYLSIDNIDYYKAKIEAVFFEQDVDGLWQEINFASGLINEFDIHDDGGIYFNNKSLVELLEISKKEFLDNKEKIMKIREKEEYEHQERLRKIELENKEQQKQIGIQHQQQEEIKKAFLTAFEEDFENQDVQVIDSDGRRWAKCEFCGKKDVINEFASYGGKGKINLGICHFCSDNNPEVRIKLKQYLNNVNKKKNQNVCPECGGELKERNGRFGPFMGCSNYPKCNYTRKISKSKY